MEDKKTFFSLEFHCDADRIKVRSHDGSPWERPTLKYFEKSDISLSKVEEYSDRIKNLLEKANQKGRAGTDILESLKLTGSLLYDELIPRQAKHELNETKQKTLTLTIDDRLIFVPWELLFDGDEFLCLRFSLGRVVNTGQPIRAPQRNIKNPLSMLIVSDPQGNLKNSYTEGIAIRNLLEEKDDAMHVSMKSSNVTRDFVKARLRSCDILHYAGHADFVSEKPSESGFLLKDGKLKASELHTLVGRAPFPSFVFSNACSTAETGAWGKSPKHETVYGLANAFLLSGVRHYLGTFWDVQDEPSLHFAKRFYQALLDGDSIGESVQKSRISLIEKYGKEAFIWTSYMLYGDPLISYMGSADNKNNLRESEDDETGCINNGSGPTRGGGALSLSETNKWFLPLPILGFFTLVILALVLFFKIETKEPLIEDVDGKRVENGEDDLKKRARIETLVKELIQKYEKEKKGAVVTKKSADSHSPSIVFLNTRGGGITKGEEIYILGKITENLLDSQNIQVVDRGMLEFLLSELNLGSSDLADKSTALKIGKIFSANLIATGSIFRAGKEWSVNLRFIETETTVIKMAITELYPSGNKEYIAADISKKIIKRVKQI